LGGRSTPVPAYAGGISLGFQPPLELVEEARMLLEQGYRAVKLRFGDSTARDIERLTAMRKAFGSDLSIMVDANTGYSLADVQTVMPAMEDLGVLWLEEPFAPHDWRSYRKAAETGRVPLAAGENHFTRFEFNRVIEEGAVQIVQPDLSKAGGITEVMRIAAMASAEKLQIHPHTLASGLNMASSIHMLCSIDNGGYFEADVAKENLFRDELTNRPDLLDQDGCVRPPEGPGLGIEVDEDFLRAHPIIDGPAYV
jgi:D-galactarolactone cycloisomerase